MDSLDAESLLAQMSEADACIPPLWFHSRDGVLGYSFHGSPNHYSWPPEQVAEIAERWRGECAGHPPAAVAPLIAAHRDFLALIEGKLEPPDLVLHDLDAGEVRARWTEPKLEVVVEAGTPPDP